MNKSAQRIPTLILIWLSTLTLCAQEQDLDAIRLALKSHTTEDTTRVNLLLDAASTLINNSPEEAFTFIDEAEIIVNEIKWKKGEAKVYRQQGDTYYRMGIYIKAQEAYQESLRSGGFEENQLETAKLYNNLANIYADLKEFQDALLNYNQYLSIAKSLNNIPNQINALANLGTVYSETGETGKSITYHEKALALARDQKMDFAICAIINNLGLTFKREGDYEKSLAYYQQARALSVTHGFKHIEATALNSIGKVNLLLKQYDIAKTYAEQALVLAKEVEALEWQADSWQILSEVYENQEDSKNALLSYQTYIELRDSISSEEKRVEFTKKDMQYRLEKQQSLAEAELERQKVIRNSALAIGGLILFTALLAYVFYHRRQNALTLKKEAEFKTQVAETELKALRSQMNPHFIFNSLNSISDYIAKNDIEKADLYLVKFSKLMRAILENSEHKWISLENEIQFINLYLEIESQRLQHKLTYNIIVDKSLEINNTLVPPLISQPFIENSIWHGIAPKTGQGHITLEFKASEGLLTCIIEDNGVGRSSKVNGKKNHSSLGIKITKNRLEIINQLRKVKGEVKIIDKDQGLKVVLTLPLELRF